MTIRLSDSAQAASSKTLAAFAQIVRAAAPEVCGLSFHDFAAETLWLSEDFLLPEDHQLVERSLSAAATGSADICYGAHDDACYAVALPVRDSRGGVNGALRVSIDPKIIDATADPLEKRQMVCSAWP